MKKNEFVSEKELTFLIANLLSVKAIFAFPRTLFETSANAAWIEVIFMTFVSWAMLEIAFLTYRISGKRSIIELSGDLGGKPLKIVISLLVILALSANFATEIRMFSESVKLILLPKTDIEYIIIMLAVTVCIGQMRGLSAIATVNAIFFPICLVFLGFIVVFLYKTYIIDNLFPVFGSGAKSILSGGIKNISCFGDIIAINLLLSHTRDISVPKKSGRKALLVASLTMLFICLSYALCYPHPMSKEYLLPVYQMSKMIRAGEYFQRFEAFFEFVWEISQLLYSAIYLFLICETATKAFGLSDRNAISYGIIALITLFAAEPSAVADVLLISKIADRFFAPIAYGLPILIPVLYVKKSRKRRGIGA
ncbi:MAG: endospore germination permease [Clostridia bacterium]|nr:endospore germination permease [Clostridia bacterium]